MRLRRVHVFLAALSIAGLSASAYALLRPDDVAAAIRRCAEDEATKQACYQALIEDEAAHRGVAAGFDVLALLYESDTEFARYCHGNTHELGKIAYAEFRDDMDFTLSSKTSYCGFGFYHGFLEAMLYDRGDIASAREFCEYVDEKMRGELNGISYACYHGIGHGVVDGTDTALWGDRDAYIEPGLTLCAELPTDVEEHKERCASGVFNALAIAYLYPEYGFDPDPDDPYDICKRQDVRYAREACYDQMNGYVNASSPDFASALRKALANAEPEYRTTAVETTAGFRVLEAISKNAQKPISGYIADCLVLDEPYRSLCAKGFAGSLLEHGKPGAEYQDALDGCVANPQLLASCLEGIVINAYDRLPPDLRESLCDDIERAIGAQHAESCRSVMRGA